MFKFIHAADLHLDSPLRGLERYEGAPVDAIRGATRKALSNLVDLALDAEVHFVLIAGDLYDGDWQDYNTGLFFGKQMSRLNDAEIPVVLIAGNHDAANKMTRTLQLPEKVIQLPTDQPLTYPFDDFGVAVHGQGFATAAVTEDLSLRYPTADTGYFNIGLLHTNATGSLEHDPYAPCTLEGLRSKNYDYWALGHIHKRQTLSNADPFVAYSGNTQGRHIGETGAKGCLLVTVNDRHDIENEFRPLDVFRWERCAVDASESETPDEILDRFDRQLEKLIDAAEDRPLAVRVEIHGACAAHAKLASDAERWVNEIRNRANIKSADQVWVEKVKIGTSPAVDTSALFESGGAMGEILALIREVQTEKAQLDELSVSLADLRGKLPAEIHDSSNVRLDDSTWIAGIVKQVEHLVAARLTETVGGAGG